MNPILTPPVSLPSPHLHPPPVGALQLNESPFRPNCRIKERIFLWRGINTAPASTIHLIVALASRASLRDTSSYGSGLCKFHIFCDIFSIPELEHLPTSFHLLHSFALWATADPNMLDLNLPRNIPFEPVSVAVVKKYLVAVQAWHIAQGSPPPALRGGPQLHQLVLTWS